MRIISISALLGLVLSTSQPTLASGDAEWRAFNVRVTRACVAASGIKNYLASPIVGFDDRVGVVAMLVSDRTRGSTMSKLCLYDKKSRKAFVDQAEMWSAPPQPRG